MVKIIGDRCLIKPEIEEKIGGLYIPEAAKEETSRGECLQGEYEGDVVVFKKYSVQEIEVDGEEYFIVDTEDILAIVEK